jgi:hypothetical protein
MVLTLYPRAGLVGMQYRQGAQQRYQRSDEPSSEDAPVVPRHERDVTEVVSCCGRLGGPARYGLAWPGVAGAIASCLERVTP